ncbi:MAG: prepilin-type N-terminal cleavage/methylation domain-containing protein [Chlamydiales bacterium]
MIGIRSTAKRSFTLFEMLIVMFLIAICFSALVFQIPKAIKKERFETAVEAVISKITLAQELMLDYSTDVVLILTEREGGIGCRLKAAQPLPKKLKARVEKEQLLSEIEAISFKNRPTKEVELRFDGSLGATPRGKLLLEGKRQKVYLTLRGYPSKILREDYNFAEKREAPYPEEIVSAL